MSEHALFFWLLVIQAAAVALIPVTIVLFRGLPDRGYLLTKPLGVIGLSYLVYAPSSFGLTDFTRGTIAGVLSLMIIAGGASAYIWREELRAFFTTRWRFVLMCEAVFLAVFLFGYWLRVQNPDVFHPYTGGEKPMDLAYLTAMLKTTDFTQGPIDPWYSGGYMNYYWWGFFIAAVPAKLLGIVPEVAFNLIVPMFFALAAAAAFSVAYNLAEGTRRFMRRRPDRTRIGMAGPVIAGMLGVFFVLIAGNLRAIDVLAHPSGGFYEASPWHPDIPLVGQVVVVFGGLWESVFGDASLRELSYRYDWWAPSRALTVETQGETPPITEFPFWTFLFADLHAHLMAIPFALTVVGVSVGIIFNFTRLNPLRRTREAVISGWVLVAVAALLVGALRWINTWDYPVFMLIAGSGILAAELARHNGVRWPALGWAILKCGVLLALAHYVFFAVTRANYHFGEVYRELPPPRSTQTTDLSDFLSHFGVFLFFMAALGLFMVLRIVTRERVYRLLFFGRRRVQRVEAIGVVGAMILLGFVAVWFGAAERWGVFWLSFMAALALVIMAFREVRRPSPLSPLLLFVYAMAGLGFTLTAFVEVYTLNGDIGRMNTVFKFYLHTWELRALVAAYGAWLIIDVMRPQTRVLQRVRETTGAIASLARPAMSPWPRALRYSFAVVAVFLVLLTVAFPYFGTRARIHERYDWAPGQTVRRSTGNDGLAWLDEVPIYDNGGERGGPHELKYTRDALTWVRENIEGSPTTFEGVGDSYRSISSRFSIYAGLPTVAAWEFHQFQQRPDFNDTVRVRQSDVSEFYSTTDIARARELIAKYGVEWVFVGDEERFIYPEEGLEKFKGGLGGVLELAYENPAIQIWHVIPEDELTGASAVVQ